MQRVRIELEFIFKASPTILYTFLTTPSCLVRWFCDKVDITGDTYTFYWNGAEEVAELVDDVEEELIRFRWEHAETDDEFLEFHISTSPVTDETIMVIADYCDTDEEEEQKAYWNSLIKQLHIVCGG